MFDIIIALMRISLCIPLLGPHFSGANALGRVGIYLAHSTGLLLLLLRANATKKNARLNIPDSIVDSVFRYYPASFPFGWDHHNILPINGNDA